MAVERRAIRREGPGPERTCPHPDAMVELLIRESGDETMSSEGMQGVEAVSRLVRYEDLIPCREAFVDCKLPGSETKVNYSIIGIGVAESGEQMVNIPEPHGFALGVAAMPHGVTNNLHIHFTAEVFMIYRGEWLFRWGPDGRDGEIIGRAGDVLSIPTWVFRGFTNIGPDDSWIFTLLGRDTSGGLIWHPDILASAAEHGLYLKRDHILVDTTTGAPKPSDAELVAPLPRHEIEALRRYSEVEMRARMVTENELTWSHAAFLDHQLPGHRSELAPVIGYGLSEDSNSNAKIMNAHGFSVDWLKVDPGQQLGPFRIDAKQVLIVRQGALEVELGLGADSSRAVAEPWATFSAPGGCWRTFRSTGDEPLIVSLTTSGDARPVIEWSAEIIAAARAAGIARDANGYLAPLALLPQTGE
jgi:hypothetical protein